MLFRLNEIFMLLLSCLSIIFSSYVHGSVTKVAMRKLKKCIYHFTKNIIFNTIANPAKLLFSCKSDWKLLYSLSWNSWKFLLGGAVFFWITVTSTNISNGCLDFWDEAWFFYHLEFSNYCLNLYIHNVSADMFSGLLQVVLVELGSLRGTSNHALWLIHRIRSLWFR